MPRMPLFPGEGKSAPDNSSEENRIELRGLMVREARKLLEGGASGSGFGTQDLENVFKILNIDLNWRSRSGLERLVEIAREKGAYLTAGDPFLGDIVLFHNQFDANGNGEVDDTFTGCGIVVKADGERFEAVVRTGHAPRSVHVWPDRALERVVDGEVVNSFLRVPSRRDSPNVPYLAGQLYGGHLDIELLVQNVLK